MKKYSFLFLILYSSAHGIIEFKDSFDLPITLEGYIKHESYWDTRQIIGVGENQILVFPAPQDLDDLCNDINNRGSFDSVPLETRLRLEAQGPNIKSAQIKGVIEADFFGRLDIINLFRLRHAYLELEWETVELLAGQTWHPMFAVEVETRIISFNSGLPIEAFARNPQIRFIYKKPDVFTISFTAISELGFVSDGPIGFSNTYMRNAVIPNLNIRGEYHSGKHTFGAALDYKRIVPRLETNVGLKAHESINSVSATLFSALHWGHTDVHTKILFVQNPTDISMIGGYAVKTIDPETDQRTYTNINALSLWTDWQFRKDKPFKFGFFTGFIKNLGARTCIERDLLDANCDVIERRVFGAGTDIDNLFRFVPRVTWAIKDFEFAAELEYTRAAFGTINNEARVRNTCPVANFRFLLAMFYYL